MKDLDIQVRYDDIDFDFKNLMGGGIIGNTINVIINVIGEEIIKTQKGEMSNLMKNAFHDIMSEYLWINIQKCKAFIEAYNKLATWRNPESISLSYARW